MATETRPAERDARIVIRLAKALLAAGKARGWSHAIEQARKQVSS